jgi:hypothetical protein
MSLPYLRAPTRSSPMSLEIDFRDPEMLKHHTTHVAKPWTEVRKDNLPAPMRGEGCMRVSQRD